MADLAAFEEYYKLADRLITEASKEQIAECARLLALNLAHYQARHGDLPLDETLAMLEAEIPNAAQASLLAHGMENLVGVLGTVCSVFAPTEY